ncbi:E3 ubiquitin protein ligase CHIP [Tanacetum coccineum]
MADSANDARKTIVSNGKGSLKPEPTLANTMLGNLTLVILNNATTHLWTIIECLQMADMAKEIVKVKLTPTGNKTCGRISGSMVPSKPTLLVAAQKKNVAKLSPKVLTSVSQKEGDEIYRTKHFASGDGAATAVITNPLRLLSVFSKAATDDVPIEISDYLSCKNILDIFHGPVITPSGLAYERVVILDYLEKHLKTRAVDMSRKRFEKQRELIERLRRSEQNSGGNGSKSSDYI